MFSDALQIITQNSEYESSLNVLKPTEDEDLSPKFLRQNQVTSMRKWVKLLDVIYFNFGF